MMSEHIIRLAERKIKLVVERLNDVLDEEGIYGSEFNKEVILELIVQNLSQKNAKDLIERIENVSANEWND